TDFCYGLLFLMKDKRQEKLPSISGFFTCETMVDVYNKAVHLEQLYIMNYTMNSQHFIKKLFKSELHRSVLAIAIGWLLTCLFYVLLNTSLDQSLRSILESQRGNFAKIEFYSNAQKQA